MQNPYLQIACKGITQFSQEQIGLKMGQKLFASRGDFRVAIFSRFGIVPDTIKGCNCRYNSCFRFYVQTNEASITQGTRQEIQRGGYADPVGWEKLPSNWSKFRHRFCYSWGLGFTVWIYSFLTVMICSEKKLSSFHHVWICDIAGNIVFFYSSSGATVYLLCRNKERGETALNQIRSKTGNMNVHLEAWYFNTYFSFWLICKIQLLLMFYGKIMAELTLQLLSCRRYVIFHLLMKSNHLQQNSLPWTNHSMSWWALLLQNIVFLISGCSLFLICVITR